MNSVMPFIPKDDQDLPDSYGMTIFYVNGKKEEFELAQHNLNKETGTVEFATKEDEWNWVPLSSVQRIQFDKQFSKIIEINLRMKGKV